MQMNESHVEELEPTDADLAAADGEVRQSNPSRPGSCY
jgi:hypothetical protein